MQSAARANRITLIAFICAVLLIGSNLVAIRYTNRELDPFWGAGVRFSIASLIFGAMMIAGRLPLPRGAALIGALGYGVLAIALYFAFVYWGLVKVQAGYGQVLLSLVPIMTLFLAIAQGMERFRWRTSLGAAIAAGGVAVIFRDQIRTDVPLLSMTAFILAAACAAQGGLILKRFPPANAIATNTVAMALGGVFLLSVSFLAGETHNAPQGGWTWAAFIYLTTVGTIATFLLYMFVLQRWTASAAAYQFVVAPIVAVALAALVLSESVSGVFFVGATLVITGVYVGVLMPDGSRGQASEPAH